MLIPEIRILTTTPRGTLLVFRTAGEWQFRVLAASGAVFGLRHAYYTADAAERAGRDFVGSGW